MSYINTTLEYWEYLKECDQYATFPLLDGLKNSLYLIITGVIWQQVIYYLGSHDTIYLPQSAAVVAYGSTCVCESASLIPYKLKMAILFASVYQGALIARLWIGHMQLYHFTKAVSILLGGICFIQYNEEDFLIYLNIYIIMCFKLMSAAEDAQDQTYDDLNFDCNWPNIYSWIDVLGYLAYTGYTPYREYLSLRHKNPQRTARWWQMILSTSARIILFRVISYKFIADDAFGDIYLCRHYYWLQMRELEPLAAGIKRGGWVKHTAFDFMAAEFSIRTVDFVIASNLPISSSIRTKFGTDTPGDYEHIGFHVVVLLCVVMMCSPTYGLFAVLFVCGIYTQKHALEDLAVRTCLVNCNGVGCNHTWTRSHKSFHVLRIILITLHQLRLALLSSLLPGWSWQWAMIYSAVAILGDACILIIIMCTGMYEPVPPPRRRSRPPRRRVVH